MILKNKIIIGTLTLGLALVTFGSYAFSNADENVNTIIKSNESDNLKNTDYIKIKHENSYTEEHWRNTNTGDERADTTDKNGNLVSKLIVTDGGKRIINICYEDGKVKDAYTWVLPDNIANENKKLSKKSLIDLTKDDIKNQKNLKELEDVTIGDVKTKKLNNIKDTYDGEYVYVDESTGLPIKRESYRIENGKIKIINTINQEYKKLDDDNKIFEYKGIELKEIPAPISSSSNSGTPQG